PAGAASDAVQLGRAGAEFCARSTSGDLASVWPLITAALAKDIEFAFTSAGEAPPPTLFQTYSTRVPVCRAKTRNAALIEVTRSGPKGAAPSWTEYLVVTPETDGTTRIDDVLFATRRSDTLRARLRALAN
ncbi:hypothetical protein CNY89_11130, partial [Amaricoccus sp. HAR-UPW-R2A-40]